MSFFLNEIPKWAEPSAEPAEVSATNSSHKTATNLLKEFCDKKRSTAKFDLLSSTGGVFVYQVKYGDVICTAEGSSKKQARHKASEALLLSLKSRMTDDEKKRYLKPFLDEGELTSSNDISDKNPIGELQEYAVAMQWATPNYDVIDETGPAHSKTFVMECTLNNLSSIGTSKSKRLAKRDAAANMLLKLGKLKLGEMSTDDSADQSNEVHSLAQLEDCFIDEREVPTSSENSYGVWRSTDKKLERSKQIEEKLRLDLSLPPLLNVYNERLEAIDLQTLQANIEAQLPKVNYSFELEKYLSLNGVKFSVQVASELCASLTVELAQPLLFIGQGSSSDVAKQDASRKALLFFVQYFHPTRLEAFESLMPLCDELTISEVG